MQKSEKVDGRGTDMGTRMLLKLKRVARKEKDSECNKCQIFFLWKKKSFPEKNHPETLPHPYFAATFASNHLFAKIVFVVVD